MAGPPKGRQTFKMDVKDFNRFLGEMHRAASKNGFSTKDVIRGEAAAVLASASELTDKASTQDINERYTLKRKPKSGKNKGKNPNTGPKLIPFVKLDGKWYSTQRYYPAAIFSRMQKRLNFYKKRAISRVYSAKAVWLVIAQKTGVFTGRFKSGARLMKAISAQGGQYAANSVNHGLATGSGRGYTIRLYTENTVLLNKAAKGNFAIASAMARRARYFEANMEKGVFKTADRIMKRYPGIAGKSLKGAPV